MASTFAYPVSAPYFYSSEEIVRLQQNAGLSSQDADMIRDTHTRVIRLVGQKLKLPYTVLLTCLYYYHRLATAYPALTNFQHEEAILACFSLALKVEETPKRLREVYAEIHAAYTNSSQPDYEAREFNDIRERILNHERILLENMEFDTHNPLPQRFLLSMCYELSIPKHIAEQAWRIAYDSFRTTLCIQKTPQTIALASLWIAHILLETESSIPSKLTNRDFLKKCSIVSPEDVKDTTMHLLNLYRISDDLDMSPAQTINIIKKTEDIFSKL